MQSTRDPEVHADNRGSNKSWPFGKFVPAGAVVAVVMASGVAGWSLDNATHHDKPVRVSRIFTGMVTIVNQAQTSGCVRPDGGGKIICAALVANPGVRAHQHVRVASTQVSTGGGNGYPLLVVLPDGTTAIK